LENPLNMFSIFVSIAPWLLEIIEALLLAAACGLLFWSRRKGRPSHSAQFQKIQSKFAAWARRRTLAVVLPGLLVLVLRTGLIPILGVPQPRWHDEFSYLLAADTFAHGRLTNPTHPMWVHFESMHIIQQPTYMSMYPPGQGLVLALGQLLGNPWIGQLLTTAVLCSLLVWALQAWLPPGWAFFGGMMAVMRLGLLSYWMNGYWSSSLPALGGTLVLGSLPRIIKHARLRDGLWMGLGAVILANTRPYEGLMFSLPVAAAMLFWIFGKCGARTPARATGQRIAPAVCILVVILAGMIGTGYYYRAVTGSAFRMAYQVNLEAYGAVPYFIWQTPIPMPPYHHEVIRNFYQWERDVFHSLHTWKGAIRVSANKLLAVWQFYLGPIFSLPLLFFPIAVRDRRIRLPIIVCMVLVAAIAAETWLLPHYFSPAIAAFYIMLIQCIRHLWIWKRRTLTGAAMVRFIPLVAFLMILLRVSMAAVHIQVEPRWPQGNLDRVRIAEQLRATPEKDLVIVRYSSAHQVDHVDYEWVYNDADIDHSEIVWARDMGAQNQELLSYFRSRRVWTVNVEDSGTSSVLTPYSPGNMLNH
jgi:hypothetical protein